MIETELDVRQAASEDLELLPSLEAAADVRFADIGMGPLPPPATAADLASAWRVLVAGDPPVGFARIEQLDGQAHLEQLSVHPDHGQRGIGGALLEAAFAEAKAAGYIAMTLITYTNVPWNAPFFARHGFRVLSMLTPGLRRLRDAERATGLDTLGDRVVMMRIASAYDLESAVQQRLESART